MSIPNVLTGITSPISIPNLPGAIRTGNLAGIPNPDTLLGFWSATLIPVILGTILKQKYSPKITNVFEREYDYIIVGGGVGGSVVASRLSEKKCVTVLVLEAGKPPAVLTEIPGIARALLFTDVNWNFISEPQKYTAGQQYDNRILYPAGKGLGGSSLVNAMLFIRGNPQDYDEWEKMGARGWGWKDVYPYFLKLEDNTDADIRNNGYHNASGPMTASRPRYTPEIKPAIIEGAKSLGYKFHDPNGPTQLGVSDFQTFTRNGQRCSAAKAYLVPADDRPNLHIVTQAFVKKIRIRHKTARGVEFDYKGKPCYVKARREVIVCAGAINTPKILMLSGIGKKKVLEKYGIPVQADLPVGHNFQDHASAVMFFSVKPVMPYDAKLFHPKNVVEYSTNRSGPLASPCAIMQLAFVHSNDSVFPEDVPNYELYVAEGVNLISRLTFGLKPEVYEKMFLPYETSATMYCISSLTRPSGRGYVTIRSSNPYDPPKIDPKFMEDPQDVKDLVAGLKTCLKLVRTDPVQMAGVREFVTSMPGCEAVRRNEDEYLKCYVRQFTWTISHQSCTAKMGDPGDPTTVVDPQLRVKGIQRLRVVDASIMPFVVSGNTDIPTTMIGEKASDMIKREISC